MNTQSVFNICSPFLVSVLQTKLKNVFATQAHDSWQLMESVGGILAKDSNESALFRRVEMSLVDIIAKMEYYGIGQMHYSLDIKRWVQVNRHCIFCYPFRV